MRTATIDLYEIFGTSTPQADILYRGKLVHSISINELPFSKSNKPGLLQAAETWCLYNGFSRFKMKG